MKKKIIKKEDLRVGWKDWADDEIIQLGEDIDSLELPEETALEIEKYITKFKARLNDTIDSFEISAEIALQNDELLADMLDEMKYKPLGVRNEETIKDMLEVAGFFVMKARSLAEQIKVEEFMKAMEENPYQLNLVV